LLNEKDNSPFLGPAAAAVIGLAVPFYHAGHDPGMTQGERLSLVQSLEGDAVCGELVFCDDAGKMLGKGACKWPPIERAQASRPAKNRVAHAEADVRILSSAPA
jgi:hypothetical protein